jgi:hypothetical protein
MSEEMDWNHEQISMFTQTQRDHLMQELNDQKQQMMKKLEEARTELGSFKDQYKQDIIESTVALLYAYYSEIVELYIQKLMGDDPGQKTVAIWGLLNILNETKTRQEYHPGIFDKIVVKYANAIPYLKLDITKEEFDDSYRGKVWIWIILLESGNQHIEHVIREELGKQPGLTPELLDELSKLPSEDSSDFQSSIDRLKPLVEPLE